MKKIILTIVPLFCCLLMFAEKRVKYVDYQGSLLGESVPKWVWAIVNNKDEAEIKKLMKIPANYKIWTFKHTGNNLDALKLEAQSDSITNEAVAQSEADITITNDTINGVEKERSYWLQDENGQYLYIVVLKKKN